VRSELKEAHKLNETLSRKLENETRRAKELKDQLESKTRDVQELSDRYRVLEQRLNES